MLYIGIAVEIVAVVLLKIGKNKKGAMETTSENADTIKILR